MISNNDYNKNKKIVMDFFIKKKNNKLKKKTVKKINVLDSLIKDFLNFSNITKEQNTIINRNQNFTNIKY